MDNNTKRKSKYKKYSVCECAWCGEVCECVV